MIWFEKKIVDVSNVRNIFENIYINDRVSRFCDTRPNKSEENEQALVAPNERDLLDQRTGLGVCNEQRWDE